MGCVKNITPDHFPKQGKFLGKRTKVCFNYDTSCELNGTIVRDDAEEPGRLIIQLDNGWFVLSTECQYSFPT
jgi:hypothetical protein